MEQLADDEQALQRASRDVLNEVLREAAREMLAGAIENEVAEYVAAHSDQRGARGLRLVAKINVDIAEPKRHEQQPARLAGHDPLTGLATRRLFEEAAARAVSRAGRGVPSALLVFDLDHFKPVNDALGHGADDVVLARVAWLVQGCLRGGDLVARIGGGEFAALLDGTAACEAKIVAERIRHAVESLSFSPNLDVRPTISIGLAQIDGREGIQQVMSRADAAMCEARKQGRNRVVRFEPKLPV